MFVKRRIRTYSFHSREKSKVRADVRRHSTRSSKDSATRFWGEERVDGAIYNVYLKKIRYNRTSPIPLQDTVDGAGPSHLEWEIYRVRSTKAATLEKLIENLTLAVSEMDSNFICVFFATYQTFTTANQVLSLLIENYRNIEEEEKDNSRVVDAVQKNIRSVLMVWMDENVEDFREPPNHPCLQRLMAFSKEINDKELHQRAHLKLEGFRVEESNSDDEFVGSGKFNFSFCDEVDILIHDRNKSYSSFMEIESKVFAEQLTFMDADLFRRLNPQHCLGSVWARRDKKSGSQAPTAKATVDQFNGVLYKVMSTILDKKITKNAARAQVIAKWIDIAQLCRTLKNFSSLKAIITALQSHPIHRLKNTWAELSKSNMQLFEDLSDIFCDENNHEAHRELLNKEGTAKFASTQASSPVSGGSTRSMKSLIRKFSDKKQNEDHIGPVYGTVPYLGYFLTDLTMIDTAFPDYVEGGLINFEKKRKEFEVLAQIKLLQTAAKSYNLQEDKGFIDWFKRQRGRNYEECCKISNEMEPPMRNSSDGLITSTPVKKEMRLAKRASRTFMRLFSNNDGLNSNGNSSGSSVTSNSSFSSQGTVTSEDAMSISSTDITGLPIDVPGPLSAAKVQKSDSTKSARNGNVPAAHRKLSHSKSCSALPVLEGSDENASVFQPSDSRWQSLSTCCIIRVKCLHNNCIEGNVYKSLLVSHDDRTEIVIRNALIKHNLTVKENEVSLYSLVQCLPSGELVIPDKGNVFYAMSRSVESPTFILKKKFEDVSHKLNSSAMSVSGTVLRIKKLNKRSRIRRNSMDSSSWL
ncbi:ral guanine nucleotide dissociation stimulator-like isoform X2 [Anneissia japonica]|uniref:ral guanine nucleotide dissociation stimulator-like isoform X2 n=1 Tax=Anneissia japonica TaxID=1529436 RepID=UPI001425A24B|nr:ral guanine nucleotide dissociation stimulator-like isoform X2 [Anneissia japonica]